MKFSVAAKGTTLKPVTNPTPGHAQLSCQGVVGWVGYDDPSSRVVSQKFCTKGGGHVERFVLRPAKTQIRRAVKACFSNQVSVGAGKNVNALPAAGP